MDGMQIKNVKKIYDKNQKNEKCVLNDVSFEIKKGEMVAVIGKSGSGKSTLLHILGCMDTISSGTYYLDGIQVDSLSNKKQAELRSSKIGFILQDFGLLPDDTVLENVILPMMFDRTNLAKVKEKAIEKLKLVGMEKQLHQKVATLSGGEKQRVAIARALAAKPAILLADEPTGNLDSKTSQDVLGLLKVTSKRFHQTIVMITHNEEIAQMADRILQIEDGKIVSDSGLV